MKTLTVTGHRPNKLGRELYEWNTQLSEKYIEFFKRYISQYLDEVQEPVMCRSGMALGVDTMFAIAVLRLRNEGLNVSLECCIPCSNHSSNWIKSSIDLYDKILQAADKVTYVSNELYTSWCMQARNEYMVDGCDRVLAVWDGTSGGTGNCVNYAKKQSKEINRIHPREIKVGTSRIESCRRF